MSNWLKSRLVSLCPEWMLPEWMLPEWILHYRTRFLVDDLLAGVVVTFVTVPQVIAYAFLVGLPAQSGIYAAIAALLIYGFFGSSRTLAVGPTAIVAILSLEALSKVADPGSADYGDAAVKLALMTGMILLAFRLLNFGALASFISHAVISGFINAAALIIMASQLVAFSGMPGTTETGLIELLVHIGQRWRESNLMTLLVSSAALIMLVLSRTHLGELLQRCGVAESVAMPIVRSAPMYALIFGVVVVWGFDVDITHELAVVGPIPTELPELSLVLPAITELSGLAPSAFVIALVVFVESNSVGTAIATRRRERINPNSELVGLGWANVGASLVGGLPVAGSFSRTVVNHAANAASPLASLITAAGMVLVLKSSSALFEYLPTGVLAAIIIVSASQLIDFHNTRKIMGFSRADGWTFLATFTAVLLLGVENGLLTGVMISFALLIRNSSRPHIAVVGRVPGTEHFRAVERYDVSTSPEVLAIRIDESLYFVNSHYIENYLLEKVALNQELKHVLLICHATNYIDTSGLEMLEALSRNLFDAGIKLHLAEVKGPVMAQLKDTAFYHEMHGKIFFTSDIAMRELGGI